MKLFKTNNINIVRFCQTHFGYQLPSVIIIPPPYRADEALSDDARLTSVGRLSVAYIGPKSRTER